MSACVRSADSPVPQAASTTAHAAIITLGFDIAANLPGGRRSTP
jgi:hypothetical protein